MVTAKECNLAHVYNRVLYIQITTATVQWLRGSAPVQSSKYTELSTLRKTLQICFSEESYLFKLEDVLVEVVLETFVSKVDTELFKAVVLVVLKTKNVKHPDGQDLRTTTPHKFRKRNIFYAHSCSTFDILKADSVRKGLDV